MTDSTDQAVGSAPLAETAAGTAPPPAEGPSPGTGHGPRRIAGVLDFRHLGLVAVLVVLGIIGVSTAETFLTWNNMLNILTSASVAGVVSVGMTFVIIGGGIDLSVGALVALASVWATTAQTQSYGFWVMILTAVIVATVAGLINGILIAYGRIVPFITTLAMLASARGLAERISNRQSQIVTNEHFANIAVWKVAGIPVLVIILAVVVLLGWILLNGTVFGRRTFAIGGNAEAARLAGINVRRHTVMLYVLVGVCCGIAAVMLASRTNTGASTHGMLYELDAIAAVIIGGTPLTGGRGTLIGTILGVLIFTTVTNLFVLNNFTTDVQNIAKGVIIVAAVLLQHRATRTQAAP